MLAHEGRNFLGIRMPVSGMDDGRLELADCCFRLSPGSQLDTAAPGLVYSDTQRLTILTLLEQSVRRRAYIPCHNSRGVGGVGGGRVFH